MALLVAGVLSLGGWCFAPGASAAPAPQAAQQAKRITGTVVDVMGPVVGAGVVVKGTSIGTSTDLDGHFTLNVSPGHKSFAGGLFSF